MIPTILEVGDSAKPSAFDRKVSSCIDEQGNQVEARINLPEDHPWRILVCVHDLEAPDLQKTLQVIKRTAKQGDTVVLVTALPQKLFDPFGQVKGPAKAPVSKQHEAEALHEMRKDRLDTLAKLHDDLPGLNVARHVLHDTNVRETIDRAAKYHKADLLIVRAPHKKHGVFQAMSVADWCTHNIDCPVVVIKP